MKSKQNKKRSKIIRDKKNKINQNKNDNITINKNNSFFLVYQIPIYPFIFCLSVYQNNKQLSQYLKKLENVVNNKEAIQEILKQTSSGGTFLLSDGIICIRMLEILEDNIANLALLNHEIFHTVDCIMEQIGSSLTSSSSENYAYLIQHISQVIYQFLKDNNIKIW